jgi:lipopolysaccharide heptosyltransferase II
VFDHLQLNDARERRLVGAADLCLRVAAPVVCGTRRRSTEPVASWDGRSILVLRLERVGDLLMTLGAIGAVRALAPGARLDLVVGSWNAPLARLIPGVDRIETIDASWLARGASSDGAPRLLSRAWQWRSRRYDLAINLEGDIRSNVLVGLSNAVRRVGFDMAGGGPMLTDRVRFDPAVHTRANALHLVERAFGRDADSLDAEIPDVTHGTTLAIPAEARARAAALLENVGSTRTPTVALHASGGRAVKQWHLPRFADVARRLIAQRGARIVLTGADPDRAMVDAVKAALDPASVIDISGRADLVELAAVLDAADLLVTGDTGPMHLAAAVGTPVVAVFGPSDPNRWGPVSDRARIVRAHLPCSPCNRIRRPPEECQGRVPSCLDGITVDAVYAAAIELLDACH